MSDRRIRVGLCGFTVAQASYPHHYGVVEIQHTFYEPPPDETLRRWRASFPPPFEFTLKAWQLITHASSSSTYRKMKSPPSPRELPLVGAFRDSEARPLIDPDLLPHFTAAEYERLCESGAFGERRVELLEGVIFQMAPIQSPHGTFISRANTVLGLALGER